MTKTTKDIDNIQNSNSGNVATMPKKQQPRKINLTSVKTFIKGIDTDRLVSFFDSVYSGINSDVVKESVKSLQERLKQERLDKLSPAELEALKMIDANKESYSDFCNGIYKDYFTHDNARKITMERIRANMTYKAKLAKQQVEKLDLSNIVNMTKNRKVIVSINTGTFNKWQFYQGLRSHNLVLKKILGNKTNFDHLPKGFEPKRYINSLLSLGTLKEKGFKTVQDRELPKKF